jgi:hypothetical protein
MFSLACNTQTNESAVKFCGDIGMKCVETISIPTTHELGAEMQMGPMNLIIHGPHRKTSKAQNS